MSGGEYYPVSFPPSQVAQQGVPERGFGIHRDVVGAHFAAGGVDAFDEAAELLEVGGTDGLGIDPEHGFDAFQIFEALKTLEGKSQFFLG